VLNSFPQQVYDTTTQKSINTSKDYGRALKAAKLPEAMARFFPIQTPILALSTPTPTEEGGHTDITPSPAGTPPDLLLPVLQGVLYSTRQLRDAIAQTEMRMVGGSILIIYEGDLERLKASLESMKATPGTDELAWSGVGNGKEGPAFAVKLIDFAHTRLEEGLGPDEGVLLGLDTTISLLEGRIKEVQESLGSA
jgi:1D-myo-inositol-tetrakisphosphate 5-kinase/inositol-polyphosphate multikinase